MGTTLGSRDPLRGGQRQRWQDMETRGSVNLRQADCLDVCESDVAVLRPTPEQRRAGAKPVWMSGAAGDEISGDLEEWAIAGGPGAAPVPESIRRIQVPSPSG